MTWKNDRFQTRSRWSAALLAAAVATSVHGQIPSSWLAPVDGNWTDSTKWSTPNYPNNGNPPGTTYIAFIAVTGAPYTVALADPVAVSTLNISASQATLALSGGTLDVTNRFTVGGNINHTAGAINLTTGSLSLGDLHGTSVYNHSGGTLNFGQYFEVGVLVLDTAQYNISNTARMTGGTLLVGANFGSGTVTQNGGTVALTTSLEIANGVNTAVGQYQLNNGALSVIAPVGGHANILVGAEGFGTFTQAGGTVAMQGGVQSSLIVGDLAGSSGTYLMSGGTLLSAANVIAHFGSGTFLQSGGHQTIAGVMRVGRDAGSKGYFELSGNSVLISNGQVNVGSAGFGTFVQSGGNYTLNSGLIIAANAVARGRYSMSGGTLSGTTMTIASTFGAGGTFEQSGGVASFNFVGGLGSFNASGTTRFTANSIQLFGPMSLADDARVSLRPNNSLNMLNSLSFAGGATPSGGRLDLANNDLTLVFASVPTVQSQIRTARNGGAWDQFGITSSAAANASPKNTTLGVLSGTEYLAIYPGGTFGGVPVLASDVLVKYTWYGDTDFNGVVNFDDYTRTDGGFLNNRSGWLNGDFDFNGIVNFDDYGLIDLAFNTQSGTLLRAVSYLDGSDRSNRGMDAAALQLVQEHFSKFGENFATSFLTGVPEPTSAVLISGVAAATCRRRRRDRN